MKRNIYRIGSFLGCLLCSLFVQGQTTDITGVSNNFFDYQKKVNAYYNKVGKSTSGYKQWKRLEWYYSTRLDSEGKPVEYQQLKQAALQKTAAMKNAIHNQPLGTESLSGAWIQVGPTSVNSNERGIGRVNRLGFIPSNESTIFAATAGGGLWRTTNSGNSWFPLTDGLPNLNLSDVVINPSNPNIIYIVTGDADGGGSNGGGDGGCCSFGKYSTGVLKSVDGGVTWNYTGLKWAETDGRLGFKLIMHPTNVNVLLLGASDGIYRTEEWDPLESTCRHASLSIL